MRDHPVVENLEQTGFPDGKLPLRLYCPVCGEECERYYIDESDMIWGCECCLQTVSAAEYDEI
jgi:ribosomal protein L37AE/L43A